MSNYLIKKGNHYSTPRRVCWGKLNPFEVWIDESWIHTEVNPGWNKLIGISDGFNHHKHSNRIVWRCKDGKHITFGHYVYQNGKWSVKEFDILYTPNQWVKGSVVNNEVYFASVGLERNTFARTGRGFNIHLYPYFGGQDTAPHDMIFKFR